jgi:hypothetical protein
MPNFFSAFTSEVFRPIVTLIIPGAIGISTWFVALLLDFPDVKDLVSRNHTESSLVLLLAMIFAGLVLEDAGARWEKLLDDRADKRTGRAHTTQWFEYLRTAYSAEPVGRRYLRTLVLRLKFELGTAFAMVSAGAGAVRLGFLGMSWGPVAIVELLCLCFVIWGLWEASKTHQVLSETRTELLKGIKVIGN